MTNQQTRSLVITRVRQQGRDIRSFEFMPANASAAHDVAFIAGQVAILRVGEEAPAYFAFASAPTDRELEILVKRTIGTSLALFDLREGEQVDLLMVFVAMGTGVAPLRSALRHVLKRKEDFGQLVVLYGARTPDDFCYRDETQSWRDAGVEMRLVISRPDGHDWSGPIGYVQTLLDHVLPDLNSPVALVGGSHEMTAQTRDRLQQMGFVPEAILTNY